MKKKTRPASGKRAALASQGRRHVEGPESAQGASPAWPSLGQLRQDLRTPLAASACPYRFDLSF